MPKYIKLAKIVVVQVIGSVEDEWCFNMLSFMKTKLRNWSTTQLDLVIHMFGQNFYALENFLYNQTIKKWKIACMQYDWIIIWPMATCK